PPGKPLFFNINCHANSTTPFKTASAIQVSDYLTWIAEAVLNGVVEFAWQLMLKKSGLPGGLDVNQPRNPFLVLGYGKVGGIELGYGSDLDIVMLYEGVNPSATATNERGRQLENALFFVRMGQKIISLMTTMMPAGILYEVDTRLRPNGASGMIVTDFESYKSYMKNKAWNWEHQALTRVRAVVGDQQSRCAFEQFKSAFLQEPRDKELVKNEVVAMRNKMREALDKSNDEQFDLKQGIGGIVDIEFMVQYLVLAYANTYPALTEHSDNVRILEAIEKAGLLTGEQVERLIGAYKVYRSKYHRVALQNEKPIVDQTCYLEERDSVKTIWEQLMA
ncbi:MAG: bifunctional [glutamate--ammonia ligase]-adenylyl-L-tyrosine phosphorylase/[glutamate--ammonia-ligase] adenylyltransferase, partial [Thiomicrorhabdus sp.]|nr:bifunctional [glutamate--ammonia ligase]-adenylyl-L-tyrosine phosphorylase/[glutamate--ammonia-ligase] adenylyltransferase [Thiomicrorhabdus sp.]